MKAPSLLITLAVAVSLNGAAFGGPPSKSPVAGRVTKSDTTAPAAVSFEKQAWTCTQCASDTPIRVCRIGDEIICPSCSVEKRTVLRGPAGKGGLRTEVRHLSPRGTPCVFVPTAKT